MRLTPDWLATQGDDAGLLHFIDTIFVGDLPDRIVVAVSGGGDSMALLHLYMRWAAQTGVPVLAATVDHGLRAAAKDEAAFVADFCARNDTQHTILQWEGSKASGNVQAAAREARYRLLARWAFDNGAEHIVLGHTADDVAETFLMRLARKSGVDGLAAMPPRFERDGVNFVRPLWQQTRSDLRDYLNRHGVDWIEDPSNEDLNQTRPVARKVLNALAPLGIDVEGLKSTATSLASARGAIEAYTFEEARRVVRVEKGDVIIPKRANPPVHPEIERRLQRAAVCYINGADYAPRETAFTNLDMALSAQDRHTIGGCIVSKQDNALRFTRELKAVGLAQDWNNCDFAVMWDGRWLVSENSDHMTQGDLRVDALGEHIKDVPDWREIGLPRTSLMATPAVFDGDTLIAAPVAGLQNGFSARIVADFTSFLLSR